MNGSVIFGKPPPLPAPAKAISSTATRPRTWAGLGSFRGVPKARVCMGNGGAPRRCETGYYHLSADGHMRLHHKSRIPRAALGVIAAAVAYATVLVADSRGQHDRAFAQPGPPQTS